MKDLHGYAISRGYRRCTVWLIDAKTRRRKCVLTLTPGPKLPRKEKYDEIYRFLKVLGPVPPYTPNQTH